MKLYKMAETPVPKNSKISYLDQFGHCSLGFAVSDILVFGHFCRNAEKSSQFPDWRHFKGFYVVFSFAKKPNKTKNIYLGRYKKLTK
jgi:hypothetical protein